MSNIGVPGTSNYIGEILAITGAMEENGVVAVMAAIGMILSASYGLFLYNRVCFGGLSSYMTVVPKDVTRREMYILAPLGILAIVLGVYPAPILTTIHASVSGILV